MKLSRLLKQYVLTRYRRTRWKNREALEAWQHRQVTAHLTETLKKSAFYREYYKDLRLQDWRDWPLMDKTRMMDAFDSLNTAGITKEEAFEAAFRAESERDFSPELSGITIGLSSGTSGSRGLFLVSAEERAAWAGAALAKALPGSLLRKHRIAFFLRADSNLYQTVNSKRIRFSFFDLIRPIGEHVQKLCELEPTLLIGPPSMLRLLAEAKRSGKLPIEPEKIISVAEVLEPIDEMCIREAFGREVHSIYQCTEGFLGATCDHGTLHLNEDILVIQREYVDASGRIFVPIITDFSRKTQPIIRYRLNDLLTLREQPCPCGSVFTAIDSISGRTDDMFSGIEELSGTRVPIFPDFIRRAVLMASGEILEFKVIQLAETELEVALRVTGEKTSVEQAVRSQLEDTFRERRCRVPQVRFVPYAFQPGLQKLRRVERRFAWE
ncbi:F390 synthetase-related protein [Paenibacillus lutrae]|uniref:Adenylate cyclase n=1 Tax=Paenibacillus lutrae TaxID=2078573 RepID=A0A7X3FJZ7_9BACL|nr:adenylate cyclase [Paenibacillus lutrae]